MTDTPSRYRERAEELADILDGCSYKDAAILMIERHLVTAYQEGKLDAYEWNQRELIRRNSEASSANT